MASATADKDVVRDIARARESLPVSSPSGPPSTLSREIERSIDRIEGDTLFGSGKSRRTSTNGRRNQLLNFDSASFQTLIKLRKEVLLKPRVTADLGLDLDPVTQRVQPLGSLNFQLRGSDPKFAKLRISQRRAAVIHTFPVDLNRIKIPLSCEVQASAGCDWHGTPDFGVTVGEVRPKWVPVAAGLVMLALRQSLSGGKVFGSTHFNSPIKGDAMGEVCAKVKRSEEGLGLSVGMGQLNLVMRF